MNNRIMQTNQVNSLNSKNSAKETEQMKGQEKDVDEESEELNEARNDSGIDYEGDELNTNGEVEEEEEEEDTATVLEEFTEAYKKKKQDLLSEEDIMLEEQRKKQRDELEKLRVQIQVDSDWKEKSVKDKRLEFLLAQSDVFTSFLIGGSSSIGKALSKKKMDMASPTKRGRKQDTSADEKAMLALEESRLTRLQTQPSNICYGTMKSFQIEGLNWMIRLHDCGVNGILADEMGLGKTLQTISLLAYLREARGIDGPHIIIVPKSTVGNWMREIHRWCPSIQAMKFIGSKEERAVIREKVASRQFDALVLSYEVAIIEKAILRKISYKYLIIDEAHRIKNENSKLSQVVREYKADHRLLITGTPLQNNLHELWALLNFLLPDVFSDSEDFDGWFNIQDDNGKQNVIKKLHSVLRPFLLRRLKVDVEQSLPPKTETKLYIGITEMQREWYSSVLHKDVAYLNSIGGSDRVRLLNVLMQLRKVCNHPYLFDGAEPMPFTDGPHLWENCGKMILMQKLLPRLKEQDSRVLIFCQMTSMLNILEDFLRYFNYDYCRLDGSTPGEDRDRMMDEFNAPDSSKFCFLLSTRAGGLGINLATADIVILYDSDWNPQVDLQAMDRAHRIGQKKPVRVFRFISEKTVEEKIVERADRKLYLDAAVIQQGRLAENNRKLGKDELMAMVRFGADEIFNAKGSSVTDEDIDALLAKGEERTEEMKKRIAEDMQYSLQNFSLSGDVGDLYKFEGDQFSGKDDTGQILPATFIALPQRERKKNYDVDEYYRNATGQKPKTAREPKQAKVPTYHDFQFYDGKKLTTLMQKKLDLDFKRRQHIKLIREAKVEELRLQKQREKEGNEVSNEKEDLMSEKLEKELIKYELSKKELEEINNLEKQGFGDWNQRDLRQFISSCERYGRDAQDEIVKECSAILSKEPERVLKYYKTFWKRYKEISDWSKILEKIEKGEKKIERNLAIQEALAVKCARYKNPWRDMKIDYPSSNKGKTFTEEEDIFLVIMMNKFGYGSDWTEIKDEIRKAWQFRFDWFFKSRTIPELQRRGEYLTKIIEKENEEWKAQQKAEEKIQRAKVKRAIKAKNDANETNKTTTKNRSTSKKRSHSIKDKSQNKRQKK